MITGGACARTGTPAEWWSNDASPVWSDAMESILGTEASSAWSLSASNAFTLATDPSLGAPVLTVTSATPVAVIGHTSYGSGVMLTALIRMRTGKLPSSIAVITVAQNKTADGKDSSLSLTLNRPTRDDSISCAVNQTPVPFHDMEALTKKNDWIPPYSSSFTYALRAYTQYLPGWAEDFRAQIEHDMGTIPGADDKWLPIRIELRKGAVAFWVDDRMVACKQDETLKAEGTVRLDLYHGVQLARCRVETITETPGFRPIALGGYFNARGLLDGKAVKQAAMPPAGQPVIVGGVPFLFGGVNLEGNDHMDIGRSLFRQANLAGYFPTMYGGLPRWLGSASRDPARIQVRIPYGQFDALYVVAAADNDAIEIPVLSAVFYRPGAGYTETFETQVPLATAQSSDATPLPVVLENGKKVNLWLVKIPLDPAKLTSFADLDIVEIEFTKKMYQYRSYPDPISYGFHQGGKPSSVHVYAATLAEVPVDFKWNPDKFGHVWVTPEVPAYTATLANRTATIQTGTLAVVTRSYDGTEGTTQKQVVAVQPGQSAPVKFSVPVKLNGYHDIVATLTAAGKTWVEKRSFVRLAPNTRAARWTEGNGVLFGYWSYSGGHHTPKGEYHEDLMTLAGARAGMTVAKPLPTPLVQAHWGRVQGSPYIVSPQAWAADAKLDPAKVEEYRKEVLKNIEQWEKDLPPEIVPDHAYFFGEPHVSPRLTAGNFPEYWNDPPFVYTEEEKTRLKMFMETSRIAAETIRANFPGRKVLIPWGDPGFAIPLLRAGFPTNLIDGCGLDVPNFERLPEMQLRDNVVHRLYALRKEFAKVGIKNPRLQACEGAFVPTEPGAVSWREQMDIYTRWNLIDMAYGVDRFYAGWFAFDCGNYYGAEHYGGCGIQRRIPYCDPKPAYAAFATMTEKLDQANFDGWLRTGSLSTYCLRFKGPKGNVYAMWTIRGRRPVTLALAADGKVGVTDCMNNTKESASSNKLVTVMTDPSVIYITGGDVTNAVAGAQDNSDAVPAPGAVVAADLGDGSWRYTSKREVAYENNHWGFYPAAGKFSAAVVTDPQQGNVLASRLEKQDRVRELMPWYNTLVPAKPITLAGAPSHLGLWVKGSSDWGRFIYVLRDAKGERWTSIGTKDDYNCDDVHGWSSFNFDGWRYLRFELPGHLGYDNFRRLGTTWWRSGAPVGSAPAGGAADFMSGNTDDGDTRGDNIVDLPVALEEIIVEQRSHILYVNDVQSNASDTVYFGKLLVEYERSEDATPEAVKESRLRMPMPKELPNLPNPIAEMARDGVGAPTEITGLKAPEHYYDGTRMHVNFKPVPGAKACHLWVSAHEDGRGAINLVPGGIKSGDLVLGLRPSIKLYYWITYKDAQDKTSKPSPAHMEVTVDNFKEK